MPEILTTTVSALCVLVAAPAFAGPVSFQQATKDYVDGKYSLALTEFDYYKASYPNNIQVHYYEGLCYQALNRLDKAKTEYQFVAKSDTGKLKAMAEEALSHLARVRNSTVSAGKAPAQVASAAVSSPGVIKVRKVIEFYADY